VTYLKIIPVDRFFFSVLLVWKENVAKKEKTNGLKKKEINWSVAYPGILFGGSTNSVEDRRQGSGGGSPLLRSSGGSCNLVQEVSFHTVKFS